MAEKIRLQNERTSCKVSELVPGDIIVLEKCNVEVQKVTSKKVYVAKLSATPGHGMFSIDVYSSYFDDGFNRVKRLPIEERVV